MMVNNILNKFYKKSPAEKRLLIEAVFWMAVTRFAFVFIPFQRVAPYLGEHNRKPVVNPILSEEELVKIRMVTRATRSAGNNLPWECKCLVQATTAKMMLNRRKIETTLYLGVLKESGFGAHAWLKVGDRILTGRESAPYCSVVSYFT